MKKLVIVLFLHGFILLAVSACASEAQSQLRAGEQKWEAQGITDYKIDVMEASIWHVQNHQLTVLNGEIVGATASCDPAPTQAGRCEVKDFNAENFTVEGLFQIAHSKVGIAGGKWTEIEFDETYGFPTRIFFDSDNAIDEEVVWRVTSFEILP